MESFTLLIYHPFKEESLPHNKGKMASMNKMRDTRNCSAKFEIHKSCWSADYKDDWISCKSVNLSFYDAESPDYTFLFRSNYSFGCVAHLSLVFSV